MDPETTEDTAPPAPAPPPVAPEVVRVRKRLASKIVIFEDDDGTEKPYTVKEMMGDERDSFLNENNNRTKKDVKGNVVGTDYRGCQSSLICRCLWDENGKKVTKLVIDKYPASTQMTLFKICQEINGLDVDEEASKKG